MSLQAPFRVSQNNRSGNRVRGRARKQEKGVWVLGLGLGLGIFFNVGNAYLARTAFRTAAFLHAI